MKTLTIPILAAVGAACVISLSATAYASVHSGRESTRGNDTRASEYLPEYANNECAVGGSPPPGANCTGRR
jgi:hypothetical protein